MLKNASLLVLDDDHQICELLQDFLTRHGYEVTTLSDSSKAEEVLDSAHFDLLIIDIMMPGEDGLTICRKIRKKSTLPIIFLSALGEDVDRIVGLEVGADDYLPKPFNPRELLARIKALLRRVGYSEETRPANKLPQICFANWILDQQQRYLVNDQNLKIPLSKGEYDLLLVFIEHAGKILSRDHLLDLTRGKEYLVFDRSIDVQVGRLRKKLEADPKEQKIIATIRNVGYQFIPEVKYKHHEN